MYPITVDVLDVHPNATFCAWVPVPDKLIEVGESVALLRIVRFPFTVPDALGAN